MNHRSRMLSFRSAFVVALLGYGGIGCAVSPTTFVLQQPSRRTGFNAYKLEFAPVADDNPFDEGLRQSFEEDFKDELKDLGGFQEVATASKPSDKTLLVRYRAAGIDEGRYGLRAGRALVNALLPVGIVPSVGGGNLGVESTFLDANGVVVGRVLVQTDVRSLLATNSGAMGRIGTVTAEYISNKFSVRSSEDADKSATTVIEGKPVVNLFPENAKDKLTTLQPLIGVWDSEWTVKPTGGEPQTLHLTETAKLLADGRMFVRQLETEDLPEKAFRYVVIVWDAKNQTFKMIMIDSINGNVDSSDVAYERNGNTVKATVTTKEKIWEVTEVLSDDGNSKKGTQNIWNGDRSQLLRTITTESKKKSS